MHTRFDDELDDLYFSLTDMASLTQKSVLLVLDALSEKKANILNEAESQKEDIKRLYHQLEGICMHLLLRRQPVASDLRRISSIMKIISDLERIGDNSADIAEVLGFCTDTKLFQKVQLDTMCFTVSRMLSEAINSFLNKDQQKAHLVIQTDDQVDEGFRNAKYHLTVIIKNGDPGSESATDLMMIAKYLERMGDHAASIANWVVEETPFRI